LSELSLDDALDRRRKMRPSLALKANADRVVGILSGFDVKNPRIFGSTARDEDDEGSDLDLLVEPGEELTFFDLARLERELTSVLGCRVEVVTPGGLSAEAAENAARDMKAFP
jgi:predicted nucleotidyltransferase